MGSPPLILHGTRQIETYDLVYLLRDTTPPNIMFVGQTGQLKHS